ncbi:hypothetical protein, partial [Nocardia veterana]
MLTILAEAIMQALTEAGERVWVVTRPRNDVSGLVPRPTQVVPAWDYHAAARQVAEDADPLLVAAAKADPTDRTAGFRAYGACY